MRAVKRIAAAAVAVNPLYLIAGAAGIGALVYFLLRSKNNSNLYGLPVDWQFTTHTKNWFKQMADNFQVAVWGVGSGLYEDDGAMFAILAECMNQDDYNALFNAYGLRGCVGMLCDDVNLAQTITLYLDVDYLRDLEELYSSRMIETVFTAI